MPLRKRKKMSQRGRRHSARARMVRCVRAEQGSEIDPGENTWGDWIPDSDHTRPSPGPLMPTVPTSGVRPRVVPPGPQTPAVMVSAP